MEQPTTCPDCDLEYSRWHAGCPECADRPWQEIEYLKAETREAIDLPFMPLREALAEYEA